MEREGRDRNREERERTDELLMQRVTGALSAPEAEALARALAADVDAHELKEWDLAAAELTVAMAAEARVAADALPASLADRIVSAGEVIVRTSRVPGNALTGAPVASPADATAVRVPRFVENTSGATVSPIRRVVAWSGWLAAAAALVWIVGPGRRVSETGQAVVAGSGLVGVRGAQLRDSLLEADSLLVRLAWGTTGDSSAIGATGDVVWSDRSQRGVMRIAGLKPNDRARWQYQLWIFDKKRDQRYPVDGGVFDIPPGSHEVFVPIDARLPVGEAVMFAVTVEPAGGVVVSTRERIALLAKQAG